MNEKKRPEQRIKVGAVIASIWRNETKDGESFQSVTFERLYRKGEKGWGYSSSFRGRELLELAKAADLAHAVLTEAREEAPEPADAEPQEANV